VLDEPERILIDWNTGSVGKGALFARRAHLERLWWARFALPTLQLSAADRTKSSWRTEEGRTQCR
jgi:hypothetical protein